MRKPVIILLFLLCTPFLHGQDFAHLFSTDSGDLQKNTRGNQVIWHVPETPRFTELLLSWNAHRPQKGMYSFFINVKHAGWSGWQKMAEWAAGYQKSCIHSHNKCVKTKHVRVEMQPGTLGNAFQIKVVAEQGADIAGIKTLNACTSNNYTFRISKKMPQMPSKIIRGVPLMSQMVLDHPRFLDLCSPTSSSMLMYHFMNKAGATGDLPRLYDFVPQFAQRSHDSSYLDIYGNWQFNVAQIFASSKGQLKSHVQRLNNFKHLHGFLCKDVPVVVSIRGSVKDAFKPYNSGHFVVVVGFDARQKKVFCIDPAFRKTKNMLRAFDFADFMSAWGKSRNLAYVVQPADVK